MGLYSAKGEPNTINEDLKVENELNEAFAYNELASTFQTREEIEAFIESDECKAMLEAGIINKNTLVRLNKNDDLSRRTTMASFQLAKDADDALWRKLAKNRIMERELIAKIVNKYGGKGSKIAKVSQKTYLKNRKSPLSFLKK